MKRAIKKWIAIGIILFHSSILLGCQFRVSDENRAHTSVEQEGTLDNLEETIRAEVENGAVSSMGFEEQSTIREYILYIMKNGELYKTKTVQEYVGQQVELTATYQNILQELVHYLGYEIVINSIEVNSNQIKVDLKQDSDLFHKERFRVENTEAVHYENYQDMAFGLLDSMMTTLRENHGFAMEVLFTEEGKEMVLPGLTIEANFPIDEAYQGSDYYIDSYLARSEGSITSIVDLGMTYNETILKLKESEISYSQTQDFSKLGDHTNWELYQSLDEYLRNAWLHIDLTTKSYQFVFDGANTELMGITISERELPSSRGLLVGDSLARLVKLYGDAYTMYVIDRGLLYEYQLEDCYFRVMIDEAQEFVLSYGIASYSQADVVHGEEIENELLYRERQNMNE